LRAERHRGIAIIFFCGGKEAGLDAREITFLPFSRAKLWLGKIFAKLCDDWRRTPPFNAEPARMAKHAMSSGTVERRRMTKEGKRSPVHHFGIW